MSSKRKTRDGFALYRPAATSAAIACSGTSDSGKPGVAEHEAAEERQVDAARHLQQRVEVGDRREAAQPAGQAGAAAAAKHGEGIEDGAVADQVEHRVDLLGLGDPLGQVRPLDLRPLGAKLLRASRTARGCGWWR